MWRKKIRKKEEEKNHSGGDSVALDIFSVFPHLLFCVCLFVCFLFFVCCCCAKHIIVGRLFRNIHPSLQCSSRSLIRASLYDHPPPHPPPPVISVPPSTSPETSRCQANRTNTRLTCAFFLLLCVVCNNWLK